MAQEAKPAAVSHESSEFQRGLSFEKWFVSMLVLYGTFSFVLCQFFDVFLMLNIF